MQRPVCPYNGQQVQNTDQEQCHEYLSTLVDHPYLQLALHSITNVDPRSAFACLKNSFDSFLHLGHEIKRSSTTW